MANYGKPFGDPAKKLAVTIACEQLTGKRVETDNYTNSHMERGHAQEPLARAAYEELTFSTVTNGGFFDNGKTGCSPDGLVGGDGIIEIKSVIESTHYATIKRGGIDPAYKWQIQFNLYQSGKAWIDYVSYCHSFPDDKKLVIYRIYDEAINEQVVEMSYRLIEFWELVEEIKRDISG